MTLFLVKHLLGKRIIVVKITFLFAQTIKFSISAAKSQNKSFKERSNLKSVIRCIYFHFFLFVRTVPGVNRPTHFLKNKQTNYFHLGKTKQKYPWKWFVTRMMFTIHQKRFSFLKKTFISFFTNGANRPGVNRPVRKMVLERIVPGGTGFGANRPVTMSK